MADPVEEADPFDVGDPVEKADPFDVADPFEEADPFEVAASEHLTDDHPVVAPDAGAEQFEPGGTTEEKVVGTYSYMTYSNDGGSAAIVAFRDNGICEILNPKPSVKKPAEWGKWRVKNKEVHVEIGNDITTVHKIGPDGSLNQVAMMVNGRRNVIPKELRDLMTYKRIKVDSKVPSKTEFATTKEPNHREEAQAVASAAPANLAEAITGKRIILLMDGALNEKLRGGGDDGGDDDPSGPPPEDVQLFIQFEKDGSVANGDVTKEGAAIARTQNKTATYKVDGLRVNVLQNGRAEADLLFPSANPEKGDRITIGDEGKDQRITVTISRIEKSGPFKRIEDEVAGDADHSEAADTLSDKLPEVEHPFDEAVTGTDGLPATSGDTAAVDLLKGRKWKYEDSGKNLGTNWRGIEYDDAAWDSGPAPLGYGDDDIATVIEYGTNEASKHITAYFRTEFEVPENSGDAKMRMSLRCDDAAIIYLNGREVIRYNLPARGVNFWTLAVKTINYKQEKLFLDFAIDPAAVKPGRNVLAAEVHQRGRVSSDLIFDLKVFQAKGASGTVTYSTKEIKASKQFPAELAHTWEPGPFATRKQTLILGKTGDLTIIPINPLGSKPDEDILTEIDSKPIKGTWDVPKGVSGKQIILTFQLKFQHLGVGHGRSTQIVEIMRHATGKLAHNLHLLCLVKPLFLFIVLS